MYRGYVERSVVAPGDDWWATTFEFDDDTYDVTPREAASFLAPDSTIQLPLEEPESDDELVGAEAEAALAEDDRAARGAGGRGGSGRGRSGAGRSAGPGLDY